MRSGVNVPPGLVDGTYCDAAIRKALLEEAYEQVERENVSGGEARRIVLEIARLLGINLAREPVNGQVWDPDNMQRVVDGVDNLLYQLSVHRGETGNLPAPTADDVSTLGALGAMARVFAMRP